jgi:hypothetical protein
MIKRPIFLLLILVALVSCRPGSGGAAEPGSADQQSDAPGSSGEEVQTLLWRHVRYLASDDLGGREVGSAGIAAAEQYIAETFESLGLAPLPERDDYFLEFSLYRGGYDAAATSLQIRRNGTTVKARPGVDFRPFDFSATGAFRGELVFAGYGITAPEYGYDDYEDLETEGKIVVLLRHEPQSPAGSDYFQGADLTRHSLFLTKAENARAHGAAGMLLITDPKTSDAAEDFRLAGPMALERGALTRYRGERQPIPAVHVAQSFAERILVGIDLQELQENLDRQGGTADLSRGVFDGSTAILSVALQQSPEEIRARNVAAFLQGSDPLLRDQWIVVGAHHDHLGSFSGEGDTVFNGADDNASGTAGVLAVAQILSQLQPPPARSIVFTTFSAEERGLLGSREMVAAQIPTDNVVLMINLDMIGRNPDKSLQVMGSASAPEVQRLLETANSEHRLALRFSGGPEAAVSDYDPFHRRGVPFLFFFTGIHDDYHGTDDEAERISYPRMAEVVKLAADTVALAAEQEADPGSTVHVDWLGLTVQLNEAAVQTGEEPHAAVTAVEPGSIADQAGLREGDALLGVAAGVPGAARQLRRSFEDVRPGQSVSVRAKRGELDLEMRVRRPYAGYLGVRIGEVDEQWRINNDLEAKSGVLVRQVLEDGPAKAAGLQAGDILLAVDGTPVGPMNLRALLTRIGADAEVELSLFREGEPRTLRLTLGHRQ